MTNNARRSRRSRDLKFIFIRHTPRGTRTNRHIETVHNKLTPATAEINTIQANGERKSGMIRRKTEPACTSASIVVMINTPHCTNAAIDVAGVEKKPNRMGEVIHISKARPPTVKSTDPQSRCLRSASLRSASRAWKRVVKPALGEAFL